MTQRVLVTLFTRHAPVFDPELHHPECLVSEHPSQYAVHILGGEWEIYYGRAQAEVADFKEKGAPVLRAVSS